MLYLEEGADGLAAPAPAPSVSGSACAPHDALGCCGQGYHERGAGVELGDAVIAREVALERLQPSRGQDRALTPLAQSLQPPA